MAENIPLKREYLHDYEREDSTQTKQASAATPPAEPRHLEKASCSNAETSSADHRLLLSATDEFWAKASLEGDLKQLQHDISIISRIVVYPKYRSIGLGEFFPEHHT